MKLRNMAIFAVLLVGLTGLSGAFPRGAQSQSGSLWQFSVKFTCGEMTVDEPQPNEGPMVNGRYRTAINFHNASFSDTITRSEFTKKALVLYPPLPAAGQAEPRPEEPQAPEPFFRPPADIRPDWGLEIDCADIREVLLGDPDAGGPQTADSRQTASFLKGYVVIIVRAALSPDVVAAYTGHALAESQDDTATATTNERGTTCEPNDDDCDLVQGFTEHIETVQPRRIG